MASIVLKKRNLSQMLESTKLAEESMVAPKRFLDEHGKFAQSFNHYLERLSIMFPEISPHQLSAELASNGNDVISTIENLKSRVKQVNPIPQEQVSFEQAVKQKASTPPQPQGIEEQIDETLSQLVGCSDVNLARKHLFDFAKKVMASRLSEEKEKKLVAENEILKQVFKVHDKQLRASKEENAKLTFALSQCQTDLESTRKTNFFLATRIKDLENSSSGSLMFGNRPIY